ncbi:tRNA epoxyqueuosine(34) reductase QueG [Hydrogenovibrio sp. JE_KL2]|uniref:tRNA epoxyqueuosine(34) reductase QueG n=1 Tax=Hydrogenovibrio sp. JE_KL2 TaxID=2651188 RepID=UPI00128CA0B9|nr:tRNA epoxyqueuosine(34) reductase QueG [Hydrogenovibrio sp. JE_KL2]MPQ75889.1 tRNA epoxyqueuosine(34) reductase QueG [Hydrogenovibrio sp. JE_KL2]
MQTITHTQLVTKIKDWGKTLGFADVGITSIDLSDYEATYFNWLGENFHGEMQYMAAHGTKRTRPSELVPGTQSIISVRMNYYDADAHSPIEQLQTNDKAYVSRYALNKDYHKLMRKRLQQLASKIQQEVPDFTYRAFADSAPVLERPIAQQAGLGFIGKNSLIIHPHAGSWFFLGELYCNLDLPADPPFEKQGCGPCIACIDECPTQAILPNNQVDARRCISYLTIEHQGSIDEALRPLIGNRIYGCDDCQLVCPWNKFTDPTTEDAFKAKQIKAKHPLDAATLLTLLSWTEEEFLNHFEGSPIRRIGFALWQRNLCIAIGNDDYRPQNIEALSALKTDSELVQEHRDWAITQQTQKKQQQAQTQKSARLGVFTQQGKPAVAPKYYLPKKPR